MNTPRRLTANEDNERENRRRELARERQRKFRERQRQQFGRVIQRRREAPTVAEVDQRTDHAPDAAGLQLIGLINYRVPVATCIACGNVFQTEGVVPALCHEAEVIGTVCPACLTPRERAAYLRRLAERAVRR